MKTGSVHRYQQNPNSRYASLKVSQQNLTSSLRTKFTILRNISRRKQSQRQFINSRRQNYLNTFYNKRRNKLIQITKENRVIHKRINQQKSYYSSRKLNKSYQSNCSNSQRSFSKQQSINGTPSRSRKNSIDTANIKLNNLQNNKLSSFATIEVHNVCKINQKNIVKFATMFGSTSKQNKIQMNTKRSIKPNNLRLKNHKLQHRFPQLKSQSALQQIVQQIAMNPVEKTKKSCLLK